MIKIILDNMKNCGLYYSLHQNFKAAFDFIESYKKEPLEVGKYEIDGENVYALVQEYESKDEARFESHQNYIDIQYIIDGEEEMQYKRFERLEVKTPYNPEKDVIFYADIKGCSRLSISGDEYAVFFPSDTHKPGLTLDGKRQTVKKIVVKVKI